MKDVKGVSKNNEQCMKRGEVNVETEGERGGEVMQRERRQCSDRKKEVRERKIEGNVERKKGNIQRKKEVMQRKKEKNRQCRKGEKVDVEQRECERGNVRREREIGLMYRKRR